jgi:NhaP-type Na+/H+ or K+/H+ antiporter
MNESAVFAFAAIGLVGIACQWLAWRVRLPAILFLLLAGLAAGPGLGWLNPDQLFGDLLFPFVSLSVAVILFEGSLSLRFNQLRGLGGVVQRMILTGLLITWVLSAGAAKLGMGFSWELSLLFGALVVVTGPTVIAPMLRVVRPKASIAEVLRWESIVIDPFGALLAVLVYEFLVASVGDHAWMHTFTTFAKILAAGIVTGAVAGFALAEMLRRHAIPDYLRNVAVLTIVASVYAGANALEPEAGLLAVTVMGMVLANLPRVPVEEVLDFKESLSVLLISTLFIVLAARIQTEQMVALGLGAIGVLLAVQFVVRPVQVAVATAGSKLPYKERALLAWIAPRGIIAAAVSAIFAPRMVELGYPEAELLVPLVFVIILGTVVLQSATSAPLARWLGVAEPEPHGFLLLGANSVARAIGKALSDNEVPVILADTNWQTVRVARMDGLKAWYGNPMTERGANEIDMTGIGGLLALTPNRDLNLLAARYYLREFGVQHLFRLRGRLRTVASTKKMVDEAGQQAESHHGRVLFNDQITYSAFASQLSQGYQIRSTKISQEFSWADWCRHNPQALVLFRIDGLGKVHPFTSQAAANPDLPVEPGNRILALFPPAE